MKYLGVSVRLSRGAKSLTHFKCGRFVAEDLRMFICAFLPVRRREDFNINKNLANFPTGASSSAPLSQNPDNTPLPLQPTVWSKMTSQTDTALVLLKLGETSSLTAELCSHLGGWMYKQELDSRALQIASSQIGAVSKLTPEPAWMVHGEKTEAEQLY